MARTTTQQPPPADAWHVPQPDAPAPPAIRFADLPNLPDDVPEVESASQPAAMRDPGWRTEIMGNGRSYIWRRGSHANRVSAPGGRFSELSAERKTEYEKNKARYASRASD